MSTILVTGANRGIGLELCRTFAARGDTVVAACRKSSPELDALGARVIADIDVTDANALERLERSLPRGRVDVLVNNAGILGYDALGGIDYGALRRQLEANAVAPLRLTEMLLPRLESGSKVALVTSRMGSIADNTSGSMYGYRMSKAALNMAGASLALDLKSRGVAVVILHPGYVRTGMTHGQGSEDPKDSATRLVARIDALTLETTGRFLHANGEALPW